MRSRGSFTPTRLASLGDLPPPARKSAPGGGGPRGLASISTRCDQRAGHGRLCCGSRLAAADEAAAEHARLAVRGVVEHAGLSGRDALFAAGKLHLDAVAGAAQPAGL